MGKKIKINYSILVLAIIGAGGVFTGSNPAYTPTELAHHIRASEAKFLISEPEILKSLLGAAQQTGIPQQNVWIFNNLGQSVPTGQKSWAELLKFGEADWVRFNDMETARTTTAARLFSSGTTGLPKAVMITHYNLIAQHELVLGADPRPYPVSQHFLLHWTWAPRCAPFAHAIVSRVWTLLLTYDPTDIPHYRSSRFPCICCPRDAHIDTESRDRCLCDATI